MRTAFIVGGVLVGGVIVYEVFLKPGSAFGPKPTATTTKTTGGTILSGLVSPLTGIFAGLGSAFSSSGPAPVGAAASGQSAFSAPYSTTQGIDPTTGGVALPAGQEYGPSVPVGFTPATPVSDGSGDGLATPSDF